ncbi:hypothetical protein PO909_008252, partial [Leuciscus waleckii]
TFFKVIFWLGYFNSCLNPIIYPCYSREFKQAFIRILRCQCQQRKQQGWRAYNYRVQTGSAMQVYTDTSSICMNGSQQTLAPTHPSPTLFSRVVGSRPASGLLPGWVPCTSSSSSSLSGSPFPGMMRSSSRVTSPCESNRMASLFPSGTHSKGPQHANGQNGKRDTEHEPISRTAPETTI